METSDRRRLRSPVKYFPASSHTNKIFPGRRFLLRSVSTLSKPPNQKENRLAKLHNEVKGASLHDFQKDTEHEGNSMVKEGDGKNSPTDFDHDVRQNQESTASDAVRRKVEKAAAYFLKNCLPEAMKSLEISCKLRESKNRYNGRDTRSAKARRFSARKFIID
ncbi:hypothetical protein R1flu_019140 [Riccia fluitans]|uniref:Uncharacterized protein n=1 Tax=Riccia fluitans TaxID=41844 RepID=A0ABD1ZI43_9MARC